MWGTSRLTLQGPRQGVSTFFQYYLHEGIYLRSVELQG